ncbi:hypothetical protein CONLIGDRAFT_653443 [Coniochaeta ligniaria NRRL 30616]|uniref:RING-type E3 ubiquitin transferase n=1 Tax=Coniochaeta ligniaria NRRL 30616 TaxID=1408157 RepID=A0A1J7ISW6_9PEZI|nr:hypothetical protein CONLIGDRAFT_653443 [Coniochaeta ligniaria NRRL 30616]
MRPPRIAILVFFCATSLFLFCRSLATLGRSQPQSPGSQSALRALLAGSLSLFPPNAAISLTEDNSTSFPGRPAAFGPDLPNKGISGILWIGTGFAEDIQDGETSEGELGCSDVPNWEERPDLAATAAGKSLVNSKSSKDGAARKDKKKAAAKMEQDRPLVDRGAAQSSKADKSRTQDQPVDDGTDDYLHENIYRGSGKASHKAQTGTASGTSHADIQSIQEAAEISGKVVLLSRGGCGFVEKVRWAQRRGAIALIVGDNQRGAPLIQMFARGNVDNVTIPSIFTSRTTAHLLSSLVQAGSFTRDILDESGRPVMKTQQSDKSRKTQKFARRSPAGGNSPGVDAGGPRGGSTTPGSGEYVGSDSSSSSDDRSSSAADGSAGSGSPHGGLISKIFGDDDGADFEHPPRPDSGRTGGSTPAGDDGGNGNDEQGDGQHGDGLWVTITPTRSGIPFFDTLVLVLISPMITLALVYALLILRSIVRRRRWRAPKSVVARLPVRTYHTMADSDSDTTPPSSARGPSPASLASPTTPLLQTSARPSPRPRSRTTTAVPDASDLLGVRPDPGLQAALQGSVGSATSRTSSRASQVEKSLAKGSQWKKFRGRQLECVICLDEYVDGVSQVMSLPCGHEFHVDCITPWLTTRRRTCPICKGDVVRSLARGSPSASRVVYDDDDSEDEDEAATPPAGWPELLSPSMSIDTLCLVGADYDF